MLNYFKKRYYLSGAAMTLGLMGLSATAKAQTDGGADDASAIAENITESISDLPGMLSAMSYLVGLMLAVLGIMKIKDHVENPSQTKLKDGAIRLAAGGALFALPIVTEAMLATIGEGEAVQQADLPSLQFGTD
ncbi:MAG: hypothetical protein L6Q57_09205 [Alphaproteobacteria bacterium]|nr:hypothetical protein [Alphaproteobacteria bacterium]